MNGNDFGRRLRELINKRAANYSDFAEKLGVNRQYVEIMMDEPFVVSNPSARLLKRIATLLGVSVGYLLGEAKEADPIWNESHNAWRTWIKNNPDVKAQTATDIFDEWQRDHNLNVRQPSLRSFRDAKTTMAEMDWDRRYQQRVKESAKTNATQPILL